MQTLWQDRKIYGRQAIDNFEGEMSAAYFAALRSVR